MDTSKIIFIVGPTASGKSDVAIEIAKYLNAEIVSADSMQIYRGMDIGTGKLKEEDWLGIKHHLMDILSPTESFSVFDYYDRAIKVIQEIISRNKHVIVVGGTGLYIRALLQGLNYHPGPNESLRMKWFEEAEKHGVGFLYEQLKAIDSDRAQQIDSKNLRRVIRALEIAQKNTENDQRLPSLTELGYAPLVFCLNWEREVLYERINQRVVSMIDKGWLKEAKHINELGLSLTARQAIGYRELCATQSEDVKEGLCAEIQQSTRRYAKRQLTWFRKEIGVQWIPCCEGQSSQKIGKIIIDRIGRENT